MTTIHWVYFDRQTIASILNHVTGERLKRIHFRAVRTDSRLQDDRSFLPELLAAIPRSAEVLTYSDIEPVFTSVPLAGFANSLVRLDLDRCYMSDDDLSAILSNSTHSLEHLGLYSMWFDPEPSEITIPGLAAILRDYTRLRSLALWNDYSYSFRMYSIGNDRHRQSLSTRLEEMFQSCPNLLALDIDAGYGVIHDLKWLPRTVETLRIKVTSSVASHWVPFPENSNQASRSIAAAADTTWALREISIITINLYKRLSEPERDRLKQAFECRGIQACVKDSYIEKNEFEYWPFSM
jgi:hypothetical protein